MFRLLAKSSARMDNLRNGIRSRHLGVLLPDGSFIKLLPNRPVDISDSVMELNKELKTSPNVTCIRLSYDNKGDTPNTEIQDAKESIVIDGELVDIEDMLPAILVLPEDTVVRVKRDAEPLESVTHPQDELTDQLEETTNEEQATAKRRRSRR